MATATVYTKMFCPFCSRALALLQKKGVTIDERPAGQNAALREEMLGRSSGGRTYPQIFIGDVHVGGCDDLHALERAGKLDALIASAGDA